MTKLAWFLTPERHDREMRDFNFSQHEPDLPIVKKMDTGLGQRNFRRIHPHMRRGLCFSHVQSHRRPNRLKLHDNSRTVGLPRPFI